MCKTLTVVQGCKATYIEQQLPPISLAFFACIPTTSPTAAPSVAMPIAERIPASGVKKKSPQGPNSNSFKGVFTVAE